MYAVYWVKEYGPAKVQLLWYCGTIKEAFKSARSMQRRVSKKDAVTRRVFFEPRIETSSGVTYVLDPHGTPVRYNCTLRSYSAVLL
jgi:hypothetical protein